MPQLEIIRGHWSLGSYLDLNLVGLGLLGFTCARKVNVEKPGWLANASSLYN